MRSLAMICVSVIVIANMAAAADSRDEKAEIYPRLRSYLTERSAEFDQISGERKTQLRTIALYVQSRVKDHQSARLTFICTHNSRRSHMSQIWAATAAAFYEVSGIETFSGGTEATAFNPRAIAAITRAGLKVAKIKDGTNPCFEIRLRDTGSPLVCYSKVYTDAPNPKKDFCAVMTCSQADKKCPIIAGCSLRVTVPYEDPKIADDTPEEKETYDECSRQICRETLYLFSQVKN